MSPTRLQADLLVVGGGPAGAAAASEAAATGLRVVLAEASPGPRDAVCGEFLSAEALPLLRDLDILDAVREAGPAEILRARFTAPRERELRFDLPGDRSLGISRRTLDEVMRAGAAARGATLLRGAKFHAPIRDASGRVVGAVLETADGPVRVEASALIGADGRCSAVARSLGLDAVARGARRCAIRAHFEPGRGMVDLAESVEIHVFAGGYVGMQPVQDGRVNVSAVIDEKLARALGGGALSILIAAASRSPAARARLEGARPAGAPRSLFPLDRRRRAVLGDGFLLAGDAACVVPPFAGEGITSAIHSGLLAARAAGEALARGDVSATGLAGYRRARREHLVPAHRVNRWLERLVYRPAVAGAVLAALDAVPSLTRGLVRRTRLA